MENEYKRLNRTLVHKGHIVDFYEDELKLANESVVKWDYIHHNGASAIVPVDKDGRIIMVKQYRIGTETELIEIPAGGINAGEDPYQAAERELTEETGYVAGRIKHLIDVYSAPAYTSECVYIYYAEELTEAEKNPDEDEIIEVVRYTVPELLDIIMDGRIVDGKTIAGIFAYNRVLQSR